MSSGYTKLFSSILASSIWSEPDNVRLVWITMLAMSDKSGHVDASLIGLAHQARKTVAETEEALAVLSSPDKYSKNPANEGRRIIKLESGGWAILNYEEYRNAPSSDEKAVAVRERVRRWRDRQKENTESVTVTPRNVTLRNTAYGDASAIASGIPDGDTKGKTPAKPAKRNHGEFQRVLLTDDEHAKLLAAYGDKLPAAIEVLDTYLEAKGKRYRNHYAVMKKRGWVWDRVFQGQAPAAGKPDAAPARDPEDIQVDRYRAMETYLLQAELRDAIETERLNREFLGDPEREMKWDYAKIVIRRARKALEERGEG